METVRWGPKRPWSCCQPDFTEVLLLPAKEPDTSLQGTTLLVIFKLPVWFILVPSGS